MDVSSFLSSLAAGKSSDSYLATESSIIYSLAPNQSDLSFEGFLVAVKSLHSFRVKSITPDPETRTILVQLRYNCSMKNVRGRLGDLPVTVHKVNPNLAAAELSTLETLRNKFRFGIETAEEEYPVPEPTKKRKYKGVSKSNLQVQSP